MPWLSLDEPPGPDGDEDDGKPYLVEGGEEVPCPRCHKPMAPDAVVCVACGFDRRKGKKVARTYEPLARTWEASYTFRQRLTAFLAIQGVSLVTTTVANLLGGDNVLIFAA